MHIWNETENKIKVMSKGAGPWILIQMDRWK